jgi:hypothetical protein
MRRFISKSHSDELDFELFSNIVLKFTSILMVVLVLLAINVGQRLDGIISTYRFSGGTARPVLYLSAYEMENPPADHKNIISFYSPSYAQAHTYVGPNGETLTRDETETISGRYSDSLFPALAFMSGISPGSILIDGKQTAFIIPNYNNKYLQYEDKDKKTRKVPASEQLALGFLKYWSDVYSNPVYPTRALSEYKNSKTRIYVETGMANGQHNFIIGNQTLTTSMIKSGRLDFLTSLSSTNTEVVYLGDYTFDNAKKTSTRLDFYDKNGFVAAAKQIRSYLFPGTEEREMAKSHYDLFATWDQLSLDRKSAFLKGANGDANLARNRYEASITQQAVQNYRNALLEEALKKNTKPDPFALPNILAYPDAWQAYVEFRLKSAPTPPEWFITEFLQPLGFDKRVMVIEE